MLFLINILKESVQSELDDFFGRIKRSDTKKHTVTQSAFSQARAKLKHTAFIEMDSLQTGLFYSENDYKTWNGFRLAAIDGSTLLLPANEETEKAFGIHAVLKNGQKKVLARISEAFDPLNHITIDASICPFVISEQAMMLGHLEKLGAGDLAIYDRNYPGFWVYKVHQAKGINFCMRIQTKGRGKFIEDFVASGKKEDTVDVYCRTREAAQKCRELGLDTEPVRCRLIRVELKNGVTEVLITSLLDTGSFGHGCFMALYHLRWPVEEDYKFLKCRLELANFSGKSVGAVHQDFYAKIFMANLTSILAFDSNTAIDRKTKHRKLPYKVNWTNAASNMKKTGALLFLRYNYKKLLDDLYIQFMVDPVSIRTDRTYARHKSWKSRQFSMCYK